MSEHNRRSADGQPHDLRRQLVMGGVALVAIASVLIGLVSSFTLGRLLLQELDTDLVQTANRVAIAVDLPGAEGLPAPSERIERPGFQVGTLIAVVADGQVSGAFIDETAALRVVDHDALRNLASIDWVPGIPQTVRIFGGLGEFRALLVQQANDQVLVVALPLGDIRATIGRLNVLIVGIATFVIAIGGSMGAWGARRALRSLDQIRQTAAQVTDLPLERGDVELQSRVPIHLANPDTEVGQLGFAFNRMLDHVDDALKARRASEEKLRHFVADASHELRTPLASIRGYAELTKRHATQVPDEVATALGRIEAESVRMTRLVEDLLLLARVDEGRPLRQIAVDVTTIAREVLSDAVVQGPDHEWSLEGGDEPVIIHADPEALFQVVSNLVHNARVHTPAGTEVVVALHPAGTYIELSVTDNGPGIPQAIMPHLFERFRRADTSRSRASGSTGLGLAIVESLTRAMGGRVSVESRPGHTCFTVALPAQFGESSSA